MRNNPKVSVIIPSYNEEGNIGDCLTSILSQSYPNYEVIIVDDGSTDNSKEIAKTFPVLLLEQKHLGPAKARNLAANKASGEILVFMDADMTFDKNFLKELVLPLIERKYRGVFSKEEYVSNWDNIWARCWNLNNGLENKRMIPIDYPDEGKDFRAILRSEFLKVGGFDDTGYTDTWTLSQKLGYKPHSVPSAKYFHKNPERLTEVFWQSKWRAKREYKFGKLGKLFSILRSSIFGSLIFGVYKSVRYKEWRFLIFKFVFDFGAFLGILEMDSGNLKK